MKVKVEFMYPPETPQAKPKMAFRWTTPELPSLDAAMKAAKKRAVYSKYTVRASNFRADGGIVVYVTRG